MRRPITLVSVAAVAALLATAAFAATGTPFGGATTSNGVLTLVSDTGDAASANDASGATLTGTGVTTFASIATLSAEFNVTDDDCSGGSPRFQIQVQTASGAKNVFVYLGPAPSFTGCSPNVWIASGNLVGSTDGRFDTSQVQAGTQVSTYAQALALVGSLQVTGISLVVDSGWAFADKEQTVMVRNVKVNDSTLFVPGSTNPKPGDKGNGPAKACKQLRDELGRDAFRAVFGTNHHGENAFGKCVSKLARTKNEAELAAAVARIEQLVDRCKTDVTGHNDKRDKGDKGDKVKRHEKHGRHTSEAANGGHRGGDDHGGLERFAGKRFAACLRDAV
jgi:hypothetical protein